MFSILALAAASSVFFPSFGMREAIYGQESLKHEKGAAAASLEILVDSDGKILRCRVVTQIGKPEIVTQLCPLLAKVRHENGRFADGTPAAALISMALGFDENDHPPTRNLPKIENIADVELTVSRLPENKTSYDITVGVAIDTKGSVSQCSGGEKNSSPQEMIDIVCANQSQLGAEVMTDETGSPIPYIRRLKVRLSTEPSHQ